MQITEGKKLQSRDISRKFSQNSISPKQELSLSSTFLKESYNNLGHLGGSPRAGPASSLRKLPKAVSKKLSSMYKDGNSATLLSKYYSVSHPHCAEIFSFCLWGRFNVFAFKVKIANSGLFSMPNKDI